MAVGMGAATATLVVVGGKIVKTAKSAIAKRTENTSQKYAKKYAVIKKEFEKDKLNSNIYDSETGYIKNPTTKDLKDTITKQGIKLDPNGKCANITFEYVIDEHGNLLIGTRSGSKMPHPTLIGGKDPKVQCAGMLVTSKGKIVSVDNKSGHYKPNDKSLRVVEDYFDSLRTSNPEIFSKNFEIKPYVSE